MSPQSILRIVVLLSLSLSGGRLRANDASPKNTAEKVRVIGVTSGDFAMMAKEALVPALEKKGYKLRVQEFVDYVRPNLELAHGKLELNIFQHRPYLESFNRTHRTKLAIVGEVPTAPLGLYGGKTKTLSAVHAGSTVAIPNDPTNQARALQMLEKLGWIDNRDDVESAQLNMRSIEKNPRKIVLLQLEAAVLAEALDNVDFAVINGNYAVSAGLQIKNALQLDHNKDYINCVVTRASDMRSAFVKDVKAVLDSEEFHKYSREKFSNYQFPTHWK